MEMPMDVLNKRLGAIRDNGDIDFDNTAAAIDIDQELREKFLFFPIEELLVLQEQIEESRDGLYLGQGIGYATCPPDADPQDLLTRAENALVLYWELKKRAEKAREKQAALLARRPRPGVYLLNTGGEKHTAIVTADRRILCPTHRNEKMSDFTEIFDQMKDPGSWRFTPVETGLSA